MHIISVLGLAICVLIKKNEMGWACGAYGSGERYVQGVGGEAGGKETIGETQT
jgi:preprotein translocase subunit SecG